MRKHALIVAVALAAITAPIMTSAQEAATLQGLLDRGFEVKAGLNQGGGYEVILQKEASVYVCVVLTTAYAGAKSPPKSQCAKLSQK
jgi:hypothetical protein